LKILLSLIGIIFIIIAICVLIMAHYIRRGINFFRKAARGEVDDEEFQRMANKYYRKQDDGQPSFDKDYFKGRNRQNQQQDTRRTMRTAQGVTIIDQRDPDVADRKIFEHDEGEYVDFKEEK